MSQEARINALEHMVVVMGKYLEQSGVSLESVFEQTQASLMGSNGPGGTTQKTEAVTALNDLKSLIR